MYFRFSTPPFSRQLQHVNKGPTCSRAMHSLLLLALGVGLFAMLASGLGMLLGSG